MEAIVLILILVLLSASSKKKKAGKAPQSIRQEAVKAASPAVLKAEAVRARRAQAVAALKARQAAARQPAEAAPTPESAPIPVAPAAPLQGISHADEEGCLGGSMPHDHAEGESREEHARHIAAVDAFDAALRKEREAEADAARERARRLRQAVVFAEILDRPRGLRPWQGGGSRA